MSILKKELVDSLALSSPNSVMVAVAGLEALVIQSLGQGSLGPSTSRWMKEGEIVG